MYNMTTKEIFSIVVETRPMHPVQGEDISAHDIDMDEKHGEDQRCNIPNMCIVGSWSDEVINIDYCQDHTQVENEQELEFDRENIQLAHGICQYFGCMLLLWHNEHEHFD